MSFRTSRFGVVISVGSLIWLFVCMFAWFGFPRSRGTQELLDRGCVSVLGWAVSLICSFNLLVALQQREPNFSPSSSRFWPPTTFLPRMFFFGGFLLGQRRVVCGIGYTEGPQWALCPSPKQYLPQPSLGSLETKPVLIPQMNLHSSLYC